MYHRERRKIFVTYFLLTFLTHSTLSKSIESSDKPTADPVRDNFENNIIDFDEDFSLKFNKKYGQVPWETNEKFNKLAHKYTIVDDTNRSYNKTENERNKTEVTTTKRVEETTEFNEYGVIPLELISTTQDALISIFESTTEADLTVIPLSTTQRVTPVVDIKQTVTLPTSTENAEGTTEYEITYRAEESETTTIKREISFDKNETEELKDTTTNASNITSTEKLETATVTTNITTTESSVKVETATKTPQNTTDIKARRTISESSQNNQTAKNSKINQKQEVLETNATKLVEAFPENLESQEDVSSFSELDATDSAEVPEDYYDGKDVLPTTAPKTDALSVIFGLAGSVVESVVESVAERVVPKSIYDLFKRMQKQNEALEAERLRSREENGGLGQFGRGILKSISTGLSKPLSQLMQGVKDIGSLDTDRGFVSSVASGVATSVTSITTSVADAFKDRVQAIYPGTVWCGDGHSATARSSDLGLFFFTDTCCRQHDACKIYIKAGETKYGLTNTGLFTRSHCSCDAKFRECLHKTNSLVSAQIGLTYFNVLGPQCFRKAHPIVRCVKRTRITGQKCEEYELDYTKPKMWQWFDNETF